MTGLNVEIVGQGLDLALIHGWGIGKSAWQDVAPMLAQRFKVHLVDLPGYDSPESLMNKQPSDAHGQQAHKQTASWHTPCRSPFEALSRASASSVPSFVHTAAALTDSLPVGCILCGWSLGSQLAMQAALLHPDHFSRLILVGGTPSFAQRVDWPHAQTPALLDAFDSAVGEDAAATLKRFIALLNQGDTKARANARSLARCVSPLPDAATLVQGLGWLRDIDLRQQVASISLPTLLIHGENDPLMPLAAAHWLADKLPLAQLEIFIGAAHAPFLNDPERFARLISDFCNASAIN
ncbi:alpha/beta fold hydrolase [Propionivibrio sp.]|uniref:alpha/beta fold hydrolase n=1 Tax=Propionivibrio sp. TaxID=2212460 RepID=UPI003BF33EC0